MIEAQLVLNKNLTKEQFDTAIADGTITDNQLSFVIDDDSYYKGPKGDKGDKGDPGTTDYATKTTKGTAKMWTETVDNVVSLYIQTED